jgi:hypothetical protein
LRAESCAPRIARRELRRTARLRRLGLFEAERGGEERLRRAVAEAAAGVEERHLDGELHDVGERQVAEVHVVARCHRVQVGRAEHRARRRNCGEGDRGSG